MKQAGFSLLELAIVIVIVGLLAGGTVTGYELLRSASLRNITGELAKFEAANVTFREQYSHLPGDMPNATGTWGQAATSGTGSDADCQNTVSYTEKTCNGNGDGKIDTSVVTLDETMRAWQHLKNAELIDGMYVGSVNGLDMSNFLGKVVPKAKIKNTGYQFFYSKKSDMGWLGVPTADDAFTQVIRTGSPIAASTIRIGGNAIAPHDLLSLESKIDNEKPGTGKIIASATSTPTCTTSTNITTGLYVGNSKLPDCYFDYTIQ